MEPISESKVWDLVKAKGTEMAQVTVLKSDGSQRIIHGSFQPISDLKLDDSIKSSGRISIYCQTDNAWRSFKQHRVLKIV